MDPLEPDPEHWFPGIAHIDIVIPYGIFQILAGGDLILVSGVVQLS
jgi:hypothetical protein